MLLNEVHTVNLPCNIDLKIETGQLSYTFYSSGGGALCMVIIVLAGLHCQWQVSDEKDGLALHEEFR